LRRDSDTCRGSYHRCMYGQHPPHKR
jgi:hypothetical protein